MSMESEYLIPHTEYIVKKGEIPSYFTETTAAQMGMWEDYRLFGFPNGGGYDNEPARYMDIIKALESECAKRQVKSGDKK